MKPQKHLYEGQHKQGLFKKINVSFVFLKNVQMIYTGNCTTNWYNNVQKKNV